MMRNGWKAAASTVAVVLTVACGTADTADTPEARRARGIELLDKAGAAIMKAETLSFTATEKGERVRRSGDKVPVSLTHTIQVRRPDRIRMSVSGDYGLEGYYDGTRVTLVSAKEKVYGAVPATGDIDTVIHEVMERYDIPFPLGDMVTFPGAARLVTSEVTGGWVADEVIGTTKVAKLSWQGPDLDWSVWIPTEGEPLPVRLDMTFKARKGTPSRSFDIHDWQVGTPLADDVFAAKVPDDYEGIPVVQRASAVQADIEKAKAAAAAPASPAKE